MIKKKDSINNKIRNRTRRRLGSPHNTTDFLIRNFESGRKSDQKNGRETFATYQTLHLKNTNENLDEAVFNENSECFLNASPGGSMVDYFQNNILCAIDSPNFTQNEVNELTK